MFFTHAMLRLIRRQNGAPAPATPGTWLTAARVKVAGAVLILSGLVLPLYSCRGHFVDAAGRQVQYVDAEGAIVPDQEIDPRVPLPPGVLRLEAGMKPPQGIHYRKRYHYFFSDFSADDVADWFRLAGFLWPMAAAVGSSRLRWPWARRLFVGLEPLLLLETALSLCIGAMFGTKEVGFWVAWLGVILYSLGAAAADLKGLSAWKPAMGARRRAWLSLLILGVFLTSSVVSVLVFFNGFTSPSHP